MQNSILNFLNCRNNGQGPKSLLEGFLLACIYLSLSLHQDPDLALLIDDVPCVGLTGSLSSTTIDGDKVRDSTYAGTAQLHMACTVSQLLRRMSQDCYMSRL